MYSRSLPLPNNINHQCVSTPSFRPNAEQRITRSHGRLWVARRDLPLSQTRRQRFGPRASSPARYRWPSSLGSSGAAALASLRGRSRLSSPVALVSVSVKSFSASASRQRCRRKALDFHLPKRCIFLGRLPGQTPRPLLLTAAKALQTDAAAALTRKQPAGPDFRPAYGFPRWEEERPPLAPREASEALSALRRGVAGAGLAPGGGRLHFAPGLSCSAEDKGSFPDPFPFCASPLLARVAFPLRRFLTGRKRLRRRRPLGPALLFLAAAVAGFASASFLFQLPGARASRS